MGFLLGYRVKNGDFLHIIAGAESAEGVRKPDFPRLRQPISERATSMHRDHDIFARAVERENKIKLTFHSGKLRRNMVRSTAPLHYSEGMGRGEDKDCYYFWDFEAPKGRNFLALRPSQIVSMEPTKDVFRLDELTSLSKMMGDSATTDDVTSNERD